MTPTLVCRVTGDRESLYKREMTFEYISIEGDIVEVVVRIYVCTSICHTYTTIDIQYVMVISFFIVLT